VQKQTFGEIGTRTVILIASSVKNVCTKIIKICQSFFKSQLIILGMLFDAFLYISLVLFSPDSAEADTG